MKNLHGKRVNVPHTRGDEPQVGSNPPLPEKMFPTRVGMNRLYHNRTRRKYLMFPTRVGMNLPAARATQGSGMFPTRVGMNRPQERQRNS